MNINEINMEISYDQKLNIEINEIFQKTLWQYQVLLNEQH